MKTGAPRSRVEWYWAARSGDIYLPPSGGGGPLNSHRNAENGSQ